MIFKLCLKYIGAFLKIGFQKDVTPRSEFILLSSVPLALIFLVVDALSLKICVCFTVGYGMGVKMAMIDIWVVSAAVQCH